MGESKRASEQASKLNHTGKESASRSSGRRDVYGESGPIHRIRRIGEHTTASIIEKKKINDKTKRMEFRQQISSVIEK